MLAPYASQKQNLNWEVDRFEIFQHLGFIKDIFTHFYCTSMYVNLDFNSYATESFMAVLISWNPPFSLKGF